MKRARAVSNTAMKDVERSVASGQKRIEAAMGRIGSSIRAGIAGALAGLSIGQIKDYADSYTRIQNALKVRGLEGKDLSDTYDTLYAAAQRQGAPLEAMATLYGRISMAQKDLNATSAEMLQFTEGVGMALRVSGQSAEQASGALLQLSQALSGGKIQAEEYNSLIDGARPVLQAVAVGLKEAGGSVSKLTALVKDGKISSEAFFRAFQAGQPVLERMASKTSETSSQALNRLGNAFTTLIGRLDEVSRTSSTTARLLGGVADAMDRIAKAIPNAAGALVNLDAAIDAAKLKTLEQTLVGVNQQLQLAAKTGDLSSGRTRGLAAQAVQLEQQIAQLKRATKGNEAANDPALQAADAAEMARRRNQADYKAIGGVSYKDYAVPDDDKGKKRKENEYQREIAQIRERTAALQQESTTIGQSAADVAKAEAEFRLLEAAKKANVAITPQLKADIESVAAAYGEATAKLEDARKAQEQFNELQQFVGESISGFLSDIVSGGKNAEEALMNLTKRLADMALQAALLGQGPLAGLLGMSGTNGGVGGLIGTLFKSFMPGRAMGGPVKAGQAYTVGETGRETFIPTTPGRIVPNGKLGGGNMQVVINNNAGAQVSTRQTNGPQGPRLEVQIDQMVADALMRGHATSGALKSLRRNQMGGR
ncbi:tape measure protein [Microvirga sp. TS319]|uniref:tape measure protein n=1 Tax=Microvirga sp. TS319 TaxID=3241165 RepID=UPI00351A6790